MSKLVSTKIAAEMEGVSERTIRRRFGAGKMRGEKKKRCIKIEVKSLAKLAGEGTGGRIDDPQQLEGLSVPKRDEALRRLGIVHKFERYANVMARVGCGRAAALARFAEGNVIRVRTLKRWIAHYRTRGAAGLVDRRGGDKGISPISEEALELFKSMYLTEQQISVKTCWQNVCFVNRDQQKGWTLPTLAAMYGIVNRRIPVPVQVLYREGLAAYEARCAPYIEIDPDSVAPGSVWVGDHSQLNCWVRYRGRWIRPWITAWQDMRSRYVVGWHISAGPNQTTILLAMKRGCDEHGPPDSAKIDNGKDFDSECFTGTTKLRRRLRRVLNAGYIDERLVAGVYAMMDVTVSFAIKYHPQSKPIERFFATVDDQLTRTIPTYCGKDPARRPDELAEYLKTEKAVAEAYTLESFAGLVGQYIEVYNNSAHTGKGMDGRTPAQVLAARTSRRVLREGVTELLMRVWSGELRIGKNGVRFKGMYYGQYDPQLLSRFGARVRASYDPDDLSRLYVYDAVTYKLITIAEQNRMVAYGPAGEADLREAIRKKAAAVRAVKAARDSQLTANMDLASLTIRARQEAAQPAPKPAAATLRPVRTPLDDQVGEHRRQETVKKVRKAAGAEGTQEVLDIDISLLRREDEREALDIDLSLLRPPSNQVDLGL